MKFLIKKNLIWLSKFKIGKQRRAKLINPIHCFSSSRNLIASEINEVERIKANYLILT
jgi:hypothetical protein